MTEGINHFDCCAGECDHLCAVCDDKLARKMAEELAFMKRVLQFMFRYDQGEEMFYNTRFMVLCNDLFWWGTADTEELNPEDVDAWEQAFVDVEAAMKDEKYAKADAMTYGGILFCARKRGMRPQKPALRRMHPKIAALFEACGPERDV